MYLDREKIQLLMQVYCKGNYNHFAKELGVTPSHIYRFINAGIGGGGKLIGGIMRFCIERNLSYEDYIVLS